MTMAALPGGILRIALDVPLRRLFDYRIPEGSAAPPPGSRVRVPFGRRSLIGVVIEHAADSPLPPERLKPIGAVLDAVPVLAADVLELVRWASDYYHHPIGEVIASALPKALREGAGRVALAQLWRPTASGRAALRAGKLARAPAQRQLLELLLERDSMPEASLARQLPRWRAAATALRKQGWAQREAVPVSPPPTPPPAAPPTAPEPTAEQARAIAAISAALTGFAAFVLHGLTGSGKTEVYLKVIEQVLAAGRGALVLVPEIGLTPQLVQRFAARLPTPVAVMHSALSDAERLTAWRAAASGGARIVVGTRSAVFAPLPDLGVIIVD
jgi:primosomal protein N' (replication factor Y) (superfamily II helicase)